MPEDREDYILKKRILMNEWRERIKQVEDKNRESDTLTRVDLSELYEMEDKVKQAFGQLQNADKDSWPTTKVAFESILDGFRKLIQEKYVDIDR
jgi:hypothetical protein